MPNTEPVTHAHPPAQAAREGALVLGRYRLERRIGAGGMGVVYLAHDEHLGREVAVKRIGVELDPDGRGEREAIAAARLSHPAIVALYESGRDEDAVYLVSELVRGRTLAELIAAGDLSDRDVVRIGMTLCDALEHAHARGVIHRDVKPSNVICPELPEDGGCVAKLTDFGIARMADGDVLTRTGDVMGTLAYMAPEQARGQRLTGAADVYALGVVLYEGLSGVNPIRAGNPAATARRVGTRLPALQRVRRDLPAGLCRAIDAAVMPEPGQRAGLGVLRQALSFAVEHVADDVGPIAAGAGVAQAALMAPRTRRSATGAPPDRQPTEGTGRTGRRRARRTAREREAARAGLERAPARADDEHRGLARGDPDGRDGAATARHDLRYEPHHELRSDRSGELGPRARRPARPLPDRLDAPLWDAVGGEPRRRDRERHPAGERPAPAIAYRLQLRAAAALAAAALSGAALTWLGSQPPLAPAAGALAAALAVLVLPRLGWVLMVTALLAWLGATAPGFALLLVLAAMPVPLLLPRLGAAWSMPALAPLLGLAGLAGAWPALAGQARLWPARAALGALGALWLVLAEALTSQALLLGQPRDVLDAPAWDGSMVDAVRDAVVPLLAGGTLALAALWALAAAVLPLLVRGRSAALDLVAAAGWAATLAAATQALSEALVLDAPRGLVAGALLAGVVAVGARAVRGRA